MLGGTVGPVCGWTGFVVTVLGRAGTVVVVVWMML